MAKLSVEIFKYSNTTLVNINRFSLFHSSTSPVSPGLLRASPLASSSSQFCIYVLYELCPIYFKTPSHVLLKPYIFPMNLNSDWCFFFNLSLMEVGFVLKKKFRPCYGYALSSRFSSLTNDSQSLDIDLSNKKAKGACLIDYCIEVNDEGSWNWTWSSANGWRKLSIPWMKHRIKVVIHVLDMENPDLWKWVSRQEQPPKAVNSNPVFVAMREGVKKNLESHAAPETRATPGQQWVRGWDDIKKGRDGPVARN